MLNFTLKQVCESNEGDKSQQPLRMFEMSPATILLAEDDPNDVFLMQRAFKKAQLSHSIQVARDGDLAIAYLAGEGQFSDRDQFPFPKLLVLDWKLPRRNGLDVLMWVRAQTNAIRRMPVVVLTSSTQPVDINNAYDAGANSYLVKPETFEELVVRAQMFDKYWLTLSQIPEVKDYSCANCA